MMKTVFKHFLLPVTYGTIVALLLLMPVLLCVPAYAEEDEAECWAVIVGVSEYEYYDDLSYTDNDAIELASQLSPIWGDDHVKLLTDSMATKQGIQNAITDWLAPQENANDVVLFFFSGRGSYNYLFPTESLTSSTANDISAGDLDSWLNTLNSQKIVVIITLCLSDSFLNTLTKTGRVILASGTPDESGFESSMLRHSAFANYVLEALREFEAADSNNNMELSAEEVFDYAKPKTIDFSISRDLPLHPVIDDRYGGQLSLLIKATIDVGPNLPGDINFLSIDGKMYSPSELPVSFIWAPGSSHNFEVVSSVSGESGIQYLFSSWDDGNTSASRAITQGGTYTLNYTTHYYLTVESVYGQPTGEGWYDAGSTATISVTSPLGAIIRQVFTDWSGDFSATTPSASVTMDGPKTITANWRTDYTYLYMIIGGCVVLIGGIAVGTIMLLRRRR